MKVALIQIDGKMPNVALMKLSAWHKKRGDEVTLIDMSHLKFDRVYGSKIFIGGSGVDLKSELPPEIEAVVPDYELFKMSKGKRIGFTSRGCIRDCGFCIVREKEGSIREVGFDWVEGTDQVILLDNNFLASPQWKEKLEYFIRHQTKVCFTQGLDIRLVTLSNAEMLAKVKYYDSRFQKRRLYFAFDEPKLEPFVRLGISYLHLAGIRMQHLMFYILVGYNTTFEQDMNRFQILKDLGCLPFIMIYNNKPDKLLRAFTRWVNKRYYKFIPWSEYKHKP